MKISQTKYWLAIGAATAATASHAAHVLGSLPGATFGEWATFMGSIFTLYGVSDIVNTHLQQAKNIPAEEQTA